MSVAPRTTSTMASSRSRVKPGVLTMVMVCSPTLLACRPSCAVPGAPMVDDQWAAQRRAVGERCGERDGGIKDLARLGHFGDEPDCLRLLTAQNGGEKIELTGLGGSNETRQEVGTAVITRETHPSECRGQLRGLAANAEVAG